MMSETHTTSDPSSSDPVVPEAQETTVNFDVTLCGQCHTCQGYFPCEQLYVLQIQNDHLYQDTGRLICFECQRDMINPRAYQVRELTREEVSAALRYWLVQRHLLTEYTTP
jgi:hypothetical protein